VGGFDPWELRGKNIKRRVKISTRLRYQNHEYFTVINKTSVLREECLMALGYTTSACEECLMALSYITSACRMTDKWRSGKDLAEIGFDLIEIINVKHPT
jgi:hypothetical protein